MQLQNNDIQAKSTKLCHLTSLILQILHTISNEQLELVNSMAPYMEKTVLPILKETKSLWQPSDFLPESSSETFLDEVSSFDLRLFLKIIPIEEACNFLIRRGFFWALSFLSIFVTTITMLKDPSKAGSWVADKNRLSARRLLCGACWRHDYRGSASHVYGYAQHTGRSKRRNWSISDTLGQVRWMWICGGLYHLSQECVFIMALKIKSSWKQHAIVYHCIYTANTGWLSSCPASSVGRAYDS